MKYQSLLPFVSVLSLFAATAAGAESPSKTAIFSMYCYWTGEATLGRVEGVQRSRIGHWGGNEIVEVEYDPSRTSLKELANALKAEDSLYAVLVTDESPKEGNEVLDRSFEVQVRRGSPRFLPSKHSLRTRHPELLELDLSEAQAIALNAWSFFGGPMPDVLTEEQQRRLEALTAER